LQHTGDEIDSLRDRNKDRDREERQTRNQLVTEARSGIDEKVNEIVTCQWYPRCNPRNIVKKIIAKLMSRTAVQVKTFTVLVTTIECLKSSSDFIWKILAAGVSLPDKKINNGREGDREGWKGMQSYRPNKSRMKRCRISIPKNTGTERGERS
jgi:hypothetical protein